MSLSVVKNFGRLDDGLNVKRISMFEDPYHISIKNGSSMMLIGLS